MKLFICFFLVLFSVGCNYTPSKTHTEPIYNSEFDHSVFEVEYYLEKNLKDPKSFEAITWGDVQKLSPTQYNVFLKYRAKNSFGGYVVEEQTFYINSNGQVYDIKEGMHSAPQKSKTSPQVATVKFLTYNCCVVEQSDVFIRIVSPRRLSISEIKKGFTTFELNNNILYICEEGSTLRGGEYAQISKMGITYDMDKEKCKFEPLK
ncbi:MAG: hypothetical protein RRY23_00010 [Alistipes sp.]